MSGLFQVRWDQLSDLEQRYVAAVASLGPAPAPVAAVAQVLGRSTQQLSTTRAALIEEHRLLTSPRYGQVQVSVAGFTPWVIARRPSDN